MWIRIICYTSHNALGYNPQVILSGRTVNNEMGRFVASKTVKLMIRHGIKIVGSKVLVLGFTLKRTVRILEIQKLSILLMS